LQKKNGFQAKSEKWAFGNGGCSDFSVDVEKGADFGKKLCDFCEASRELSFLGFVFCRVEPRSRVNFCIMAKKTMKKETAKPQAYGD